MITCTICKTSIEKNYCPNCGQKYTAGKLNLFKVIGDAVSNFFSLESKLLSTLVLAYSNPKKLADNYLAGYKDFYFSPGRFLLLASFVFGLNFLFENKDFFVISFGIDASTQTQLSVFAYVFVFLTLSSYFVYFKQKKSFVEHLAVS